MPSPPTKQMYLSMSSSSLDRHLASSVNTSPTRSLSYGALDVPPTKFRFPHTRALLSSIARQHKPFDTFDIDNTDHEVDEDGSTANGTSRVSPLFVNKIIGLLDEEKEDDLKKLLKDTYGMDDETLEQNVLDLMHKHHDDISGVPFSFLTPSRRPISRPSSRASSHSFTGGTSKLSPAAAIARPETPTGGTSTPSSPLSLGFRRPHTPAASPLAGVTQATSYMSARSVSPHSSPIMAHVQATYAHAQFAASLPSSPLSSPRLLSAKASEFKPSTSGGTTRPLSAAAPNSASLMSLRAETPSPDLWSHSSNPLARPSSNLAIAAPLIPDSNLLPRASTPSSLRATFHPRDIRDEDEENDPFDPFSAKKPEGPLSFHSITVSDFDSASAQWSSSISSGSPEDYRGAEGAAAWAAFEGEHPPQQAEGTAPAPADSPAVGNGAGDVDPDVAAVLTDGMTPFDVLSSVFGSTLAPSELEDALAQNGYDFDRAMGWLVDKSLPSPPSSAHHQQGGSGGGGQNQIKMQPVGNRVTVVSGVPGIRGGRSGYAQQQSPPGAGARPSSPRYGGFTGTGQNGRVVSGGNRVCRYFIAGECLRADCRFSHDLERALCRFWLRGTCAKQDQCEFLHHLPKDVDVSGLSSAMSRTSIAASTSSGTQSPPPDEFPALGVDNGTNGKGRKTVVDSSRTRFSSAVKKAPPSVPSANAVNKDSAANHSPPFGNNPHDPTYVARREAMGNSAESIHHRSAIIAPRSSPRIKLRPPSLLPTLPTGETINALYMAYRSRALQLGAARNACLSRAADAWRRGDGAAAKRFSREGHDLNAKMGMEMTEAAGKLVRERAKIVEQAVRTRDSGWSDDPGDRTTKGNVCGGGFGVLLGIVGRNVGGEGKMTPEERTECLLDLHGLHSNEATEVLETFLLALEHEHFYGLAYVVVGEEKHTGTQDVARGASRARLATGVREWVHRWGYPWSERDGVICIDPLTHS